jgi:anti-anti-sigma factor
MKRFPRPPPVFSVHVLREPDSTVQLTAEGELDISTVHVLRDALHEQIVSGQDVLLDLSSVEFMDASGIRVILDAISNAKVHDLRLCLAPDLRPFVKRLLEVTAILPLLPTTQPNQRIRPSAAPAP